VTFGELSQRLRRADFLDGLGIYVGTHEVALAHVSKRFFNVSLKRARTFPLPTADRPAERRQALTQAVLAFVAERRVDTRRAYLCLPREEALFNRVVLPAAARENLAQVLEYDLDHLVPLPKDQLFLDWSVRSLGEDRIEVLLMCIPREVVRVYLETLGDAFVRPRGIVLASTAIADYLAFCQGGDARGPIGLMIGDGRSVELALLSNGRLVASQLVPAQQIASPAELSRSLARQLADGAVAAEEMQLFRWQLANGSGPTLPDVGDGDLVRLASGRLEAPTEFFEARDPAVLPALGAALDAVREGSVPVNLLPTEGRLRDEGISLTTIVLFALAGVLLLVWGGSALLKDELLRRQLRDELAARAPQVEEAKNAQSEIEDYRHQLEILAPAQERRVTVILKELSDLIPQDAHLTSLNMRQERLTLEGLARSASELVPALDKSKLFRNVSFSSPTTKTGDKERFTLTLEVEK
jgi:general secretion pathway protein L